MLSAQHISPGINFWHICTRSAGAARYGCRASRLIPTVILYSCEIKRTGPDYNHPEKGGNYRNGKDEKPTEIISPAHIRFFRVQLVLLPLSRAAGEALIRMSHQGSARLSEAAAD